MTVQGKRHASVRAAAASAKAGLGAFKENGSSSRKTRLETAVERLVLDTAERLAVERLVLDTPVTVLAPKQR